MSSVPVIWVFLPSSWCSSNDGPFLASQGLLLQLGIMGLCNSNKPPTVIRKSFFIVSFEARADSFLSSTIVIQPD